MAFSSLHSVLDDIKDLYIASVYVKQKEEEKQEEKENREKLEKKFNELCVLVKRINRRIEEKL